jgi:hypothetical protein
MPKSVEKEIRSTDELYPLIKEEIEEFEDNSSKFQEKGIASAASRARKNTTILAKLFKEYRAATVAEVKAAKEQKKAEKEEAEKPKKKLKKK